MENTLRIDLAAVLDQDEPDYEAIAAEHGGVTKLLIDDTGQVLGAVKEAEGEASDDAELVSTYSAFREALDQVDLVEEGEQSEAWYAKASALAKAALQIPARGPAGLAVKIGVLGWYSGLLLCREDDMEGRAWLDLVGSAERVTGVRI